MEFLSLGLFCAKAAKAAWDEGQGTWPQMSVQARIEAMEKYVAAVKERREEIINVLMWEICKNTADAVSACFASL